MTIAERNRRRMRDKRYAEESLRLPRGLKAREVAAEIRRQHPELAGRSKWRTIGAFCRMLRRRS